MTKPAPFLRLDGITKSFEGVRALDDVSMDVTRGTVHALVGENGAGKSTLGKIIAGVHSPDTGSIVLEGDVVRFPTPRSALERRVTIVAQELALVPTRSVIENVYLGSELHAGPFVRTGRLAHAYEQLMMSTGIVVPPQVLVQDLSIADQQRVEILRALARNASLIVMDEPTARLDARESVGLLNIVKVLRDTGTTIVYVSHFLDEVLDLADDISVLRDGRLVRSATVHEYTRDSLITEMIGRPLAASFPEKAPPDEPAPTRLAVQGLGGVAFKDVSLEVHAGEIVALTGLVGSGRTEVLRAIYGADRATTGSVLLDGRDLRRRRPSRAVRDGIVLLPESRKTEGLFLDFSILDNVALPSLRRFSRAGFLRNRARVAAVQDRLADVGVRMRSIYDPVGQLSGGNQQKTLFAKSILALPRVLLIDEPTRGVDVGAKRQIYELIAQLAATGIAILLVSSELEEVVGLAHRVIVMRQGRVAGVLVGNAATDRRIADLAFGQSETSDERPEQ